jgi:predicted permease
VLTAVVSLPQPDTYGPPLRESFCHDLARAAEEVGGVHAIGAISHLPLSGANAGRGLTIEGRSVENRSDGASASYRVACPGYFATLQIPLLEGRDFTTQDVTRGQAVAIVNRAMAETYWPGGNAIGKRFKLGDLDNDNPWLIVAGVAENVRHFGLDSEPRREFFVPYAQSAWPVMTIVARTASEPALSTRSMRELIRRVDPQLPVAGVRSMEDVIDSSISWRETPMRLLTGFSLVGLLLASLGVYGVLAYYVSQRTREIGVRAALGATRAQIAALVIRQSLAPIAAGAALGVAGSFASGRLLQELLYEVQPGDPQVISVIVALFAAVGILASWLPAHRAAAIDPVTALRNE